MMAAALLASSVMLVGAQSLSDTKTLWGKALTTPWTTQGCDIAKAADGGIFIIGGAGTKAVTEQVKLGDDVLTTGTLYTGSSTSGNQVLVLSKVDAQGTPVWTVHSNPGEVGNNQSWVAPTSDGGVVAGFKFRHTDGHGDESPVFYDATGKGISLNWTLESAGAKRYYRGVVLKVNAQGSIEWVKQLNIDHSPQPNASDSYKDNTGEAYYVNGFVTDENNNIYMSGRICKDMTVTRADGSTVTIPAHNNAAWDGDPQKDAGNLFLLKLDADGNYVSHIVTGGESAKESALDLTLADGKLYLLSLITGKEKTAVTLGGKSVTPVKINPSLALACLDTDLNVQWFNLYQSTMSGSTMQTPSVNVLNGNIWITGKAKMAFNYTVNGVSKSVTTTKVRAGLLLKLDADGNVLKSYVKDVNQAGYFATLADAAGNVYVLGHTLLGPLTIEKFDAATLVPTESVTLYSNTSDTQGIAVDGDKLYVMARTRGNGNSLGNVFSLSPAKFSCLVAGYQLPFSVPTAVSEVEAEKTVQSVQYFNLQGMASSQPFEGFNVKVTTYTDGTRKAVKQLLSK